MSAQRTTVAIPRYPDQPAAQPTDSAAEPVGRALLARAVNRLHFLCAGLFYRKYPRFAHQAALVNFRMIASDVWDTARAVGAIRAAR
jgi:hypothetical protein